VKFRKKKKLHKTCYFSLYKIMWRVTLFKRTVNSLNIYIYIYYIHVFWEALGVFVLVLKLRRNDRQVLWGSTPTTSIMTAVELTVAAAH
jgi:hypothetical protein